MKRCYKEREIKSIMQRELELPIVVTERIVDVLHQTCTDYSESDCKEKVVSYKKKAKVRRQFVALFAICLFGIGTTVGAMELKKWHEYAAEEFHASVEQQDKLTTDGLAANPAISVTDNGVTVSVEQVVADSYSEYILLKVEAPKNVELPLEFGFASEFAYGENSELSFEEPTIRRCSGQALIDWNEETGQLERINGESNVVYYAYMIYSTQEDVLQGKEITIRLKDIIEYLPKAQSQVVLEGEWALTLPLEVQQNAQKEMVTYKMLSNKEGKMNHVLNWENVTMTPIQLMIEFDYQDTIPYSEENESFCELTSVLPHVKKIKLKNGDILEIDTKSNDYVEFKNDEKTQNKYEEFTKLRDYEAANRTIQICGEWSVKLCVNFSAAAKVQTEDNNIWQSGIINPEEVEELVVEYQGEEYSYKVVK